MVLQILHQSMQPLLAALQAWLYQGLLQGSPHIFFIHEGRLYWRLLVSDTVQTWLHQSCTHCNWFARCWLALMIIYKPGLTD